jgi:hypothetical protein
MVECKEEPGYMICGIRYNTARQRDNGTGGLGEFSVASSEEPFSMSLDDSFVGALSEKDFPYACPFGIQIDLPCPGLSRLK